MQTSASYLKSRYFVRFDWCYIIDLYVPCELSQVLHIWMLTVSVFTCVLCVTSMQWYFVSVHLWFGPPCAVWVFTGVSYNWLFGIVWVLTRDMNLHVQYEFSLVYHIIDCSVLCECSRVFYIWSLHTVWVFIFQYWFFYLFQMKILYNHYVILLEH
jgi:hypothetical protein